MKLNRLERLRLDRKKSDRHGYFNICLPNPYKLKMGPKKTADTTPKTISSFMEAEQLMWAKKMGEGDQQMTR